MLIDGTPTRDFLDGTDEADLMRGFEGDDRLRGHGGDDTLEAGPGKDSLDGGEGDDLMIGGDGRDRFGDLSGFDTYLGGLGADTIIAVDGGDWIEGGDGDDQIEVHSIKARGDTFVFGGLGDDVVRTAHQDQERLTIHLGGGSDSADIGAGTGAVVFGGAGDDYVSTGAYPADVDKIVAFGGAGNDAYYLRVHEGLPGARVIDGGSGADAFAVSAEGRTRLTLGEGADLVQVRDVSGDAPDRVVAISDFAAGDGGDVLDVSELLLGEWDAGPWDSEGDPFARGFLRLVQDGTAAVLEIDWDAGGAAHAWRPFVAMANADAADFTAANLAGYDPDAG